MDKLSEHTLLDGENNGPSPLRPLKKSLNLSEIKKMTLLDEIKSGGFVIQGKLMMSFSTKRIHFFVTCHRTRLEHFLTKAQLLGFELINSENFSSIHLAVRFQTACVICSKLITPPPTMTSIKMMIKEFTGEAEKSGTMSHCIVRIQFRRKLKQEEIEQLKHFYPVIGRFPTPSPEEEYLNFENDQLMDNGNDDDQDLLDKMPSDQELSDVEEEEEELKPLNLDVKKLKIGQHTICYSATKFSHYITLIVDDENLRIIGNGQINQYIEEKVYFYFKIPINSSEIDRQYEVAAVPGLKSRIKFSLSSEESNYVRGLLKKSLGFYGIDKEVGLTRFEFILATELNGLQLAQLRSIENLHLITKKSEKKCVQVKNEIQEEQMDIEEIFSEMGAFEKDDSIISVQFQSMSLFRNCSNQNLELILWNQNDATIKVFGNLNNKNNEFKFQIPLCKIENLELKKIARTRKNCIVGQSSTKNDVHLILYLDAVEMELIRNKLSNLGGCLIKLTQNYLEFTSSNEVSKSYDDCERIIKIWKKSRTDKLQSAQNVQIGSTNEDLVLICQSIHFGQYVYSGQISIRISSRPDETTIHICMRNFKGKKGAQLVISESKKEPEGFKMKYFLSDYGANHWTLFFIPDPKCQNLFASKLKFPQLVNFFDPSSEDMEKSYIRLVFEFPPSLQERDKKIEFCNKLNEIFDTYILSYIDLTAENNIKIIEKNLSRINNETCMETG